MHSVFLLVVFDLVTTTATATAEPTPPRYIGSSILEYSIIRCTAYKKIKKKQLCIRWCKNNSGRYWPVYRAAFKLQVMARGEGGAGIGRMVVVFRDQCTSVYTRFFFSACTSRVYLVPHSDEGKRTHIISAVMYKWNWLCTICHSVHMLHVYTRYLVVILKIAPPPPRDVKCTRRNGMCWEMRKTDECDTEKFGSLRQL